MEQGGALKKLGDVEGSSNFDDVSKTLASDASGEMHNLSGVCLNIDLINDRLKDDGVVANELKLPKQENIVDTYDRPLNADGMKAISVSYTHLTLPTKA